MATSLSAVAVEESTYVVTAAFTNEDGDAVTPNTIVWTLTDKDGTIINSRENVSVTPAASINIVLTDDDLVISGSRIRIVTVLAVYDSSYGTDLTLKGAAIINLENLMAVT